jgi:hypothetical protein
MFATGVLVSTPGQVAYGLLTEMAERSFARIIASPYEIILKREFFNVSIFSTDPHGISGCAGTVMGLCCALPIVG